MRSTSSEKINKSARIMILFLSIFFYYFIFHYDYRHEKSLIDYFFYDLLLAPFTSGSYDLTQLADKRWSAIFDFFLSPLYFFIVWKYRIKLSEMVFNFWKKI